MLKQIMLTPSGIQDAETCEESQYVEELRKFREQLQKTSQAWPDECYLAGSPLPFLIPRELDSHLKKLSDILTRSITDIVERWFDPEEHFTERMPLEPWQEKILRWIDGPGKHLMKPFAESRGNWRPDFLIRLPQLGPDGKYEFLKQIAICEINARFAFNGFLLTALGHLAFDRTHGKRVEDSGLESSVVPEQIFEEFKSMLDSENPVHILKGEEHGIDVQRYHELLQVRYGIKARFIKPKDIRLISGQVYCIVSPEPVQDAKNALDLFSTAEGEWVEKLHQVALELRQHELRDLGEEILRAIAPICFNDLRTIFLVHDKRFLGILRKELRIPKSYEKEYPAKHKLSHVVSEEEASILEQAIIETFVPGSMELKVLVKRMERDQESKDEFMLKPAGSGKGQGIVFGSDISLENWLEMLRPLLGARADGTPYVLQRVLKQQKFEVVVPQNGSRSSLCYNHLVGTFMMMNGQYLGPGVIRTSQGRLCSIAQKGSWMLTFMGRSNEAQNHLTMNKCPFRLHDIIRIKARSPTDPEVSWHTAAVEQALSEHGVLIIDLDFEDPTSSYLTCLIEHLHGEPLNHSSSHGVFWEVRPAQVAEKNAARSKTMDEFPWHTDCSFESKPPSFFALQVIQADRCGGGTLSILESKTIIEQLSNETVQALSLPEFHFKVPSEFHKRGDSMKGRLLDISHDMGLHRLRFRYREDIIEPLTPRATEALTELRKVLAGAYESKACINLTPDVLPNRSIVVLNNHRWLHSRNEVKDKERHLRRIRWDARAF